MHASSRSGEACCELLYCRETVSVTQYHYALIGSVVCLISCIDVGVFLFIVICAPDCTTLQGQHAHRGMFRFSYSVAVLPSFYYILLYYVIVHKVQ